MEIDDFISRVASEPDRIVSRTIPVAPQDLLARAKSGGVGLMDFLSAPGRQVQQRDVRYRHILEPPASQQAIDAWSSRWPLHPLPVDLQVLLSRINGIHLWANVETGRSYVGLAPIEEWEPARIKMYGPAVDRTLLHDRYIAVSYHADHAAFVVLDVESGSYYLMDVAGPDTSSLIANNASELLDWLWSSRVAPKP